MPSSFITFRDIRCRHRPRPHHTGISASTRGDGRRREALLYCRRLHGVFLSLIIVRGELLSLILDGLRLSGRIIRNAARQAQQTKTPAAPQKAIQTLTTSPPETHPDDCIRRPHLLRADTSTRYPPCERPHAPQPRSRSFAFLSVFRQGARFVPSSSASLFFITLSEVCHSRLNFLSKDTRAHATRDCPDHHLPLLPCPPIFIMITRFYFLLFPSLSAPVRWQLRACAYTRRYVFSAGVASFFFFLR